MKISSFKPPVYLVIGSCILFIVPLFILPVREWLIYNCWFTPLYSLFSDFYLPFYLWALSVCLLLILFTLSTYLVFIKLFRNKKLAKFIFYSLILGIIYILFKYHLNDISAIQNKTYLTATCQINSLMRQRKKQVSYFLFGINTESGKQVRVDLDLYQYYTLLALQKNISPKNQSIQVCYLPDTRQLLSYQLISIP